jgi:hypothetical protein
VTRKIWTDSISPVGRHLGFTSRAARALARPRTQPTKVSLRDRLLAGPPRDTAIDGVAKAAAGRIDPGGYRDTYANFNKLPHNPYLLLANMILIFAAAGIAFVGFWRISIPLAIGMGSLFFVSALLTSIFAVRRIPAWHRARAAVRAYIEIHGGEMPPELRTWR